MPRVIHFEISADDPERAVKFYSTIFGWKIERWPEMECWLVSTGENPEPGIDGAIQPRTQSSVPIVNTISVPSVDEFIPKIVAQGGKVIMSKSPIPGVGYFAQFLDSEGNPFGIIESDPSATA